MRSLLALVLAGVLVPQLRKPAQPPKEKTFDCGTIKVAPSGKSMAYHDITHGFHFEFPLKWVGSQTGVADPAKFSTVNINPVFARHDPKFYRSEGATVSGTKTVNGFEWTTLTWPDGRIGYYTYQGLVAMEFVAEPQGKNRAPSADTLAGLEQILRTFSFEDEPYRLDRQLAMLKPGQKMGGLRIKRILRGPGGFGGYLAKIQFDGRLTLSGTIGTEASRLGPGPYFLEYYDEESLRLVPHLTCPATDTNGPRPGMFYFTNQDLPVRLFGTHGSWETKATVVLGDFSRSFNVGIRGQIRARLVRVISTKPIR